MDAKMKYKVKGKAKEIRNTYDNNKDEPQTHMTKLTYSTDHKNQHRK